MNGAPGRNDPCPCGSGKKYKRCCGQLDVPVAAAPASGGDFQSAVAHHQAGRVQEAERLYRAVLQIEPDHPDALYLLGVLTHQSGDAVAAIELIERAVRINPGNPYCHDQLGTLYKSLGRLGEAEPAFRRALEIHPEFTEAHYNLGVTLQDLGRSQEAEGSYRRALRLKPDLVEAHFNLGVALKDQGRLGEAEASYLQALRFKPDHAQAHNNLGNVLKDLGRSSEAEASYRRTLTLKPDHVNAHINLALVLYEQGRFIEAEAVHRRALAFDPENADVHRNLGVTLQDQGRLAEAEACFRRSLEIRPEFEPVFSNLLFVLNYDPDKSAEEIFAAYREYDARFGIPHRAAWRPHSNSAEPGRRLKVGYVTPDFRLHSARHCLEPLLAHHDRSAVEVFAYAELEREDAVTGRYKGYVDHWIPTRGMTDEMLAERIRSDGIDVLADLAGHTANNRLQVFARRPAPVSVSFLGFGYTTGLSAIDYLITDAISAPEGSDALFAEAPWRIETPQFVYRPADGMGEVGSLPASERGYVTFGTLSRAVRINHHTVRVWSELLKRVPNSRMVVDSRDFRDAAAQAALADRFAAHGIGRERLDIGCHSPPWDAMRGMDIGLDCFPHNSALTIYESLYMGMPVVTLAGRPSVGRLGGTLLAGAGHPEWIARTELEYVEIAAGLARDLSRLAALRAVLRGQVEAGRLMDEPAYSRKVEAAYRGMWAIWCEKGRR